MKWAPNPYTIAEQISAKRLPRLDTARAEVVDAFLRDAFLSKSKKKTVAEAFAVFQQIAELFYRPVSLGQAIHSARGIWEAAGYSGDQVIPLLPDLLPIVGVSGDTPFSDADKLIVRDATYLDPVQGAVNDCYLIAAMIALAWTVPELLTRRLTASGFNPPPERSFQWQFHDHAGNVGAHTKVSGRLMMTGNIPRFARSSSPTEDWPGLVEKAYVEQARGADAGQGEPTQIHYHAISSGDTPDSGATPTRACQCLVGGRRRGRTLGSLGGAQVFLEGGLLHTSDGVMTKPVMAWTREDIGTTDPKIWDETGLWPNHAYAVLGVMDSGHVVLRNPHGLPTSKRRGYAASPWEVGELSVTLNDGGVFALSRNLFYAKFNFIGWIDLE